MSLQAWYPFNGNYENLGLGDLDLTVQTSPTYTTGKVTEQALNIGNFSWTPEQSASVLNNQALSFSFWLKPTASTQTGGSLFVQHPSLDTRRFCIFTYPTLNDLHLDWRSSNGTVLFTETVWTGFFPINTWTHCAITYEYPNVVKIYRNGSLYKTLVPKATLDITDFKYSANLCGEIANRHINDFRVYDHCLSPKEVKEISKGLMLHYPLDNCGLGCKNYIKDSYYVMPTICAWGNSTYARSQIEIDDDYFKGKFWKFTRGASGSGDIRIGWGESRIPIDPNIYNDNPLQFSIWVKSTTGTSLTIYSARMSDQEHAAMKTFDIPSNKWTRVECSRTFLSSSSAASVNELEIYLHISYNTDATFAKAKLEVGDRPTPWRPNEADELYSQIGMDENIEYDTSGYGNNGTKIGTLDYESNSPRYNCSSYLNGTDAYIQVPKINLDMNNITASMWFNVKARSSYMRLFDFGSAAGGSGDEFVLELYGTSATELSAYITGTSSEQIFTGYNLSNLNTWYHVACTTSNGTVKIYVNGNLVKTASGVVATRVFNLAYNYIGKSNWADPLSNCRISDFRIYSTCLSDSDIQELYNKPISIDSSGNLFAQEIIEEVSSTSKFEKSGIVKAEAVSFAPIQDMKIKTLDDGSVWARILHHNNKSGTVVFTSSNVMNIQSIDLYSRLYLLENFRDSNGAFEFMAIQPELSDKIYRWKQTNNPTKSGSISGYINVQNGLGGLVYGPNSQTLMSVSGTTSNWWCAVGCYVNYNNGLPGFDQKIVNQTLDFYVRIDTLPKNNKFNIYNQFIECSNIIEN